MVSALNVKVMETHTSADPGVLWLRAGQLCHLGGHAPQSGEICGSLKKLKDGMTAFLLISWTPLKADEEDRKTAHAPLVAVTKKEVAMLTATIQTNLRQGELESGVDGRKGDLTETESNEAFIGV